MNHDYFHLPKVSAGLEAAAGVVLFMVVCTSNGQEADFENITTNTFLEVQENRVVSEVQVGVIIEHARSSDLVLHLVSPQGTRILLADSRGGLSNANYGANVVETTVNPTTTVCGPWPDTNVIETITNEGVVRIDYECYVIPDTLAVYYDNEKLYDTGLVNGSNTVYMAFGPGLSTNITIVANEQTNDNYTTCLQYTATVFSGHRVYVTFTENTNLARLPIRCVPPPYTKTNLTSIANGIQSDFETTIAGTYTNRPGTNLFDGWLVLSNQIEVVADPNIAAMGTNFLALSDGRIRRALPTQSGRQYKLIYCYRDPGIKGWWAGNSNALDFISTNHGILTNGADFDTGEAAYAFRFNGDDAVKQQVRIPFASSLSVTNASIEAWIKPYSLVGPANTFDLIFGQNGGHPQMIVTTGTTGLVAAYQFADTGGGYQQVPALTEMPLHQFTHVVGTFDGTFMKLYLNGRSDNQFSPLAPPFSDACDFHIGGFLETGPCAADANYFNGLIDEVSLFDRALSAAEVQAMFRAGAAGKAGADTIAPQVALPEITHWWQAENNASDTVGTMDGTLAGGVGFAPGLVGQALTFDGVDDSINFGNTNLGNFGTNDFSIEFWFRTGPNFRQEIILSKRERCVTLPTDLYWQVENDTTASGRLVFRLRVNSTYTVALQSPPALALNDNQFHHVAIVRQADPAGLSDAYTLFVDGRHQGLVGSTNIADLVINITNAANLVIGTNSCVAMPAARTYPFTGQLDELTFYSKALTTNEIAAIYNAGAAGKTMPSPRYPHSDLSLDDRIYRNLSTTNTTAWVTNVIPFTASTDGTPLVLRGSPLGLLFDGFILLDTTDSVFYQPEQPLSRLVGENSQGNWQLEIWDNRLGVYLTNNQDGLQINWRLQLGFLSPNLTIVVLTNHQPCVGALTSNDVAYFAVDTPLGLASLTNTLSGADYLDLFFNPRGLPLTGVPGDVALLPATTGGQMVLDPLTTPPLTDSQRYFLAVRNTDPLVSNTTYTIQVDWDAWTEATLLPLSALGQPVGGALDPGTRAFYAVFIPTNAAAASFELFGLNGSARLLAKQGFGLPASASYDYASEPAGMGDKQIIIQPDSVPVPLAPGRWSIGIEHSGTNTLAYQVRAMIALTGQETSFYAGKRLSFATPPWITASGGLSIVLETVLGRNYLVQYSDQLGDWRPLATITAQGVQTLFTDPDPAFHRPARFYRIVPAPGMIALGP